MKSDIAGEHRIQVHSLVHQRDVYQSHRPVGAHIAPYFLLRFGALARAHFNALT
jgi:hypothetical protein